MGISNEEGDFIESPRDSRDESRAMPPRMQFALRNATRELDASQKRSRATKKEIEQLKVKTRQILALIEERLP
jgi:hypothetical protein